MKIIQGKSGSGKANQLLKMFLQDSNSATFISDELDFEEIYNKTQYLLSNGIDIVDKKGKEIKTNIFTNCNSDYYLIVKNVYTTSIYLNLHIPSDFRESFITFCIELEREYGVNIVMTEQLNANSEIKGINILELGIK